MYALFAWATAFLCPSQSTEPNGLPLANTTRPFVARNAWAGVHSACEVGLDIAKTIGRGLRSAIARSTGSVNRPDCPDSPTNAVGRRLRMAPTRSVPGTCACAYGCCWDASPLLPRRMSPSRSKNQQVAPGVVLGHPLTAERGDNQVGGPHPDSGTHKQNPLLGESSAGQAPGVQHPGQDHGRRTLDVIVEDAGAHPVPGQQAEGVGRGEVLELDQRAGEYFVHGLDEFIEQAVDTRYPKTWLGQSDIVRIPAEGFVLGAQRPASLATRPPGRGLRRRCRG